MKRRCLVLGLVVALGVTGAPAAASGPFYACPPCGCTEDGMFLSEPGSCSGCTMPLIAFERAARHTTEVTRAQRPQDTRRKVAILVFPRVQIIDFAAPYEVFGQAGFEVYTVGTTTEPIETAMGLTVTPKFDLATAPAPDIVVVPGGRVRDVEQDPEVLDWLRARQTEAESILSVCNGAFILAHAGLLEGKTATTFHRLIPGLRTIAENTQVVEDRRYVDNGQIVTTAGLSSGLDGSLHVVAKLLGSVAAQRIALNLEYDWTEDETYARANFVDQHLSRAYLISASHYPYLDLTDAEWTLEKTAGDADAWSYQWRVRGASAEAIVAAFDAKFRDDLLASQGPHGHASWTFQAQGRDWTAQLEVDSRDDTVVTALSIRAAESGES